MEDADDAIDNESEGKGGHYVLYYNVLGYSLAQNM